jgi:hypothetical protein
MRRADRDFRYHLKASKNFLMETRSLPALTHSYPRRFTFYVAHPIRSILPSTFRLLSFLVRFDSAANDDMRDAVIARLAKAAWDSVQSLGQ